MTSRGPIRQEQPVLTGTHFINGDTACAEGALAAGCRFFAGYPITPASEIAERMSERLPALGGEYIQMEDELASMAAVVGASNAGGKAMTATSGPGISLMNENIGLAAITETPCVIVNVQRGGPSTGMPTLPAQGDVMQARYGSHGDYPMVAYAPDSPQEMFDLTVDAFNTAEAYRTPVIVLADQTIGHMTGKVEIPDTVETHHRPRPDPDADPAAFRPFDSSTEVPPMAVAGDGYRVHVTGLTHDQSGNPDIDPDTHKHMLERIMGKIQHNRDKIVDTERYKLDDATVAVIAYGLTSRPARQAVRDLRDTGIPVGLLRLRTLWPFPEAIIKALSEQVTALVVAELNCGQYVHRVREHAICEVAAHTHPGGELPAPAAIAESVTEVTA